LKDGREGLVAEDNITQFGAVATLREGGREGGKKGGKGETIDRRVRQ